MDWVSRIVIVAISRRETGYFHVRYPRAVIFDDLLTELRREFGLPEVSYVRFWLAVRTLADEKPNDHGLLRTLALIPRGDDRSDPELAAGVAGLFRDGASQSCASNTDRLMADAGISWPELGPDVFKRCALYHRRSSQASACTREMTPARYTDILPSGVPGKR